MIPRCATCSGLNGAKYSLPSLFHHCGMQKTMSAFPARARRTASRTLASVSQATPGVPMAARATPGTSLKPTNANRSPLTLTKAGSSAPSRSLPAPTCAMPFASNFSSVESRPAGPWSDRWLAASVARSMPRILRIAVTARGSMLNTTPSFTRQSSTTGHSKSSTVMSAPLVSFATAPKLPVGTAETMS